MKRDSRSGSYVDPLHPLMRLPRFRLFSSSFTICSLLPPLTSNSTSKIHRSVCAINPNNFELESLHIEFPFTYVLCALPSVFFSSPIERVTNAALTRKKMGLNVSLSLNMLRENIFKKKINK